MRELAAPVEQTIEAYRTREDPEPQDKRFLAVWRALVAFWDEAGPAPFDEDGDPDYDSTHYTLCRRAVEVMHHRGFDPETDEGEDYLTTAATDLYEYLDEGHDEPDEIGGRERLEDGTRMVVDTFLGEVVVGEADRTYRREQPKVGRNAPCPCGSGKKYKRCGLKGACELSGRPA